MFGKSYWEKRIAMQNIKHWIHLSVFSWHWTNTSAKICIKLYYSSRGNFWKPVYAYNCIQCLCCKDMQLIPQFSSEISTALVSYLVTTASKRTGQKMYSGPELVQKCSWYSIMSSANRERFEVRSLHTLPENDECL